MQNIISREELMRRYDYIIKSLDAEERLLAACLMSILVKFAPLDSSKMSRKRAVEVCKTMLVFADETADCLVSVKEDNESK